MRKFLIALAILAASASTAWACKFWTYSYLYNGRLVTCNCTDCGYGVNCNCY